MSKREPNVPEITLTLCLVLLAACVVIAIVLEALRGLK